MIANDSTSEPAPDELTLLRQRVAELEQQVAAHAATDERLNCAEAELRMFKALIESAIDGISFATPDRIVQYANDAFGTMSGYGERCIGLVMSDL